MFRFASPYILLLILLVPVILWLAHRWKRRGSVRFSSKLRLENVKPSIRIRLLPLLTLLRAAGLIILIVALARPQTGIGEVRTTADGIAIMLVLDRSWSMSEVMEPGSRGDDGISRIDVVKKVSRQFIEGDPEAGLEGRPEDLIGLVTFGRFADTICPLVRIHETIGSLIDQIELAHPQSLDAGTAIGEGLALAAARLQDAEDDLKKRNEGVIDPEFEIKSKIIVLMTDGDENMGEINATQAANICKKWGIKIYAIGIGGNERGTTIQTMFGPRQIMGGAGFNESLLKHLAETTGGIYRSADDSKALRAVYDEIGQLETTEIQSREYTSYNEAFLPWAIAGGLTLLLEIVLSSTFLRRSP